MLDATGCVDHVECAIAPASLAGSGSNRARIINVPLGTAVVQVFGITLVYTDVRQNGIDDVMDTRPGKGVIHLESAADCAGAGGVSTSVNLANERGQLISQARLAWQPA